MDWTRRRFLQAGALIGSGLHRVAAAEQPPAGFFALHPFIEANPRAVFIRRTNVPVRMDSEAKRAEGLSLAREIFVPSDRPGIPISHRIALKPNIIARRPRGQTETINWGTDPEFYEGLLIRLRELGLRRFHFIEANYYYSRRSSRYDDIHDAFGAEVVEADRRPRHFREDYQINWSRVPDAVIYQRIAHYPPLNEPDTWLLNVAKWRSHGMCLTQSVKNLQGLTVRPFQRFCPGWAMVTGVPEFMRPYIHPDVVARVTRYFESHRKMGYSRYDSQARLGPIAQEIWAHKTCDNLSILKPGLSLIEAIYARNEDPSSPVREFLPNMVMFSKDPFRLDLVGLWLGGHEPGNVHLYRIAKERGLSDTFNPWDVPVYEWDGGQAIPRKLTDFPRTEFKTYYLQKEGEPLYHLVNEPFDYDRIKL